MKFIGVLGASLIFSTSAMAVPINWVDWQNSTMDANGFTATGQITSGTETVSVTYNNPNRVSFFQDGEGAEQDWWAQQTTAGRVRDPASSPFTSTGANGIDNIPTGTDMIALNTAGTQSLTFSEAIANPVFAFISLNRNGYGFDQDFDLLSSGSMNLDGAGADDCGWWGCGTSTKDISADGLTYSLNGTGEPHGALRFNGAFDTVSWNSLSNENWNGFTIGVEGTAAQIFPPDPVPTPDPTPNPAPTPAPAPSPGPAVIPLPAPFFMLLAALGGLVGLRRKA